MARSQLGREGVPASVGVDWWFDEFPPSSGQTQEGVVEEEVELHTRENH